eukprot:TRINITY_DN3877_c0_g1_i1.p1 TRINITY_DN3877_c0_g1~~TRINITY_DN3877_c0_g1_i1.p1  ORF type:complete len:137 (+),score=18.05 TRINITY_DN3877_c0_g1_i1:121-531(+)
MEKSEPAYLEASWFYGYSPSLSTFSYCWAAALKFYDYSIIGDVNNIKNICGCCVSTIYIVLVLFFFIAALILFPITCLLDCLKCLIYFLTCGYCTLFKKISINPKVKIHQGGIEQTHSFMEEGKLCACIEIDHPIF